jgi:hypothetical protein
MFVHPRPENELFDAVAANAVLADPKLRLQITEKSFVGILDQGPGVPSVGNLLQSTQVTFGDYRPNSVQLLSPGSDPRDMMDRRVSQIDVTIHQKVSSHGSKVSRGAQCTRSQQPLQSKRDMGLQNGTSIGSKASLPAYSAHSMNKINARATTPGSFAGIMDEYAVESSESEESEDENQIGDVEEDSEEDSGSASYAQEETGESAKSADEESGESAGSEEESGELDVLAVEKAGDSSSDSKSADGEYDDSVGSDADDQSESSEDDAIPEAPAGKFTESSDKSDSSEESGAEEKIDSSDNSGSSHPSVSHTSEESQSSEEEIETERHLALLKAKEEVNQRFSSPPPAATLPPVSPASRSNASPSATYTQMRKSLIPGPPPSKSPAFRAPAIGTAYEGDSSNNTSKLFVENLPTAGSTDDVLVIDQMFNGVMSGSTAGLSDSAYSLAEGPPRDN